MVQRSASAIWLLMGCMLALACSGGPEPVTSEPSSHPGSAGSSGAAAEPAVGAGRPGRSPSDGGTGPIDGEAGEAGALGAAGAPDSSEDFDWQLPTGFPVPFVPPDNPMSTARVELGRHLFYDRRLSGNETQSCADCHHQDKAFTDGRATALGSTSDAHPRGSQSLANAAYYSVLTWANPLMLSLEQQALIPMFSDSPVELGLAGLNKELLLRLREVPKYQTLFSAAFPHKADAFELASIVDALACFERTLISGHSPYDDAVYGGNSDALSEAQRRGQTLFFSEKGDCYHCHGGFNFSDNTRSALSSNVRTAFHNTALYNTDGKGAYPEANFGVFAITGDPAQMGQFRTPSLRNVELTAPYMHDGSVGSLEEVVAIYSDGGRAITSGPNAGDGRTSPLKDSLMRPLGLSDVEQADLVAFLKSLTDRDFVTDPRFSNPWP
jgi:cytochrome c peroxidase